MKNSFMFENWTNLPEGLVSNITSCIIGCEVKVLQRKWKPSIYTERVGESKYYAEMRNKCLKGDKALSYALKPSKELLSLMKYDDEIMVGIEVSAKHMYHNNICRSAIIHQVNRITSQVERHYKFILNKQLKK